MNRSEVSEKSGKDTLQEMKLGTENYIIVLGCPVLGTSPCLHRLLFRAVKPPARQPLSIMREVHLTLSPCTRKTYKSTGITSEIGLAEKLFN